jgi:hypothetical protein
MGGTKSPICNEISTQIWNWAMNLGNVVSAEHLTGTLNVLADTTKPVEFSCWYRMEVR